MQTLQGVIIGLPALKRDPKSLAIIDPPEGKIEVTLPKMLFSTGAEQFLFSSDQLTPARLSYARMLFVDAGQIVNNAGTTFVQIVSGPYTFKVWAESAAYIPFPALNPFNLNISITNFRAGATQPLVVTIFNFVRRSLYWSA
jgi:hypothetical protein